MHPADATAFSGAVRWLIGTGNLFFIGGLFLIVFAFYSKYTFLK
ncbi:hypothetical protein SAMN06265222_1163 [Neorhodopirellula lusitana]|uniref:Uncharacterized protein n=1 Tax=Neorhodopirellula lusitana TaxID=445327 RepID=A0ABY1QN72_9BACT|nr:hypothetical protein SAMN06265222_1163 [Neorhodopirellula lusitana]